MAIDEELREQIMIGASTAELKKEAVRQGMSTLRMSALRKMGAGLTTMEEVVRETVK